MRTKKRGNLAPNESSILLNLRPMLAARNILHPSAYLTKMGINSKTTTRMLKGEAVQGNFRQLTTLCVNLSCTPNDLLVLRKMNLPENHPLNQLRKIDAEVKNPNTYFDGKTLQEIEEILK